MNGISRNSILRFDPSAAGTSLNATHEWNLTADLPAVGANLGIEAITWIPDAFLISRGFIDQTRGPSIVYNPADYPNHGAGLFFVGLEANGMVYAYALDHVGGGFIRVATIATGLAGVMDLQFDRERRFRRSATMAASAAGCSASRGHRRVRSPNCSGAPGMPNLNNEDSPSHRSSNASATEARLLVNDSETGACDPRRHADLHAVLRIHASPKFSVLILSSQPGFSVCPRAHSAWSSRSIRLSSGSGAPTASRKSRVRQPGNAHEQRQMIEDANARG